MSDFFSNYIKLLMYIQTLMKIIIQWFIIIIGPKGLIPSFICLVFCRGFQMLFQTKETSV